MRRWIETRMVKLNESGSWFQRRGDAYLNEWIGVGLLNIKFQNIKCTLYIHVGLLYELQWPSKLWEQKSTQFPWVYRQGRERRNSTQLHWLALSAALVGISLSLLPTAPDKRPRDSDVYSRTCSGEPSSNRRRSAIRLERPRRFYDYL